MNHQGIKLLKDMRAEGFVWSVEPSSQQRDGVRGPQTVETILVRVTSHADTPPSVFEEHFIPSWDYSLEQMLSSVLRRHFVRSRSYVRWLESHGNVPVELVGGVLENIPEAVHTALRKLADSKQSVLTWNAIHKLHPFDRSHLWAAIESVLRTTMGSGVTVTRRILAQLLRDRVKEALETSRRFDPRNSICGNSRALRSRDESETFALLVMQAGVDLTGVEEWMYGWLGYVVNECPTDLQQAA